MKKKFPLPEILLLQQPSFLPLFDEDFVIISETFIFLCYNHIIFSCYSTLIVLKYELNMHEHQIFEINLLLNLLAIF